ncbi:GNAT family N-acetyltransferase [Aquimarina addita]|uniref:GNAT family N-acetyltransferase n=1 Tax=Aquimarina addita TaxID=870485 RepID=A0ABP6UJY5_9FLAO
MITKLRVDATNVDFKELVKNLDKDLAKRDGDDHSFYAQFNKIDVIKHAVVVYKNNIPIGCGAIKRYNSLTTELKRMYTMPSYRGKGIASIILKELEIWAIELSYESCILETGKKQPEAIALYKKMGYHITANYGQYKNIENSLCFEKKLK